MHSQWALSNLKKNIWNESGSVAKRNDYWKEFTVSQLPQFVAYSWRKKLYSYLQSIKNVTLKLMLINSGKIERVLCCHQVLCGNNEINNVNQLNYCVIVTSVCSNCKYKWEFFTRNQWLQKKFLIFHHSELPA